MMRSSLTIAMLCLSACAFPLQSKAHGQHQHDALKAGAPSETSLFNLDSKWVSESGEAIAFSSLKGQPRIVAMLYTACKTACPMIIHDLKTIRSKLPDDSRKDIVMTVFSFDPERDTPQALSKFKKTMKIDDRSWSLYSPSKAADARELAAALGVQFKRLDNGEFIHSNVVFFLNEEGEIVARKEGLGTPAEEFLQKIITRNSKKMSLNDPEGRTK